MGEEVGTAWVRLVPSMRGFAKAAAKGLGGALPGPAKTKGKETGEKIGDGVDDGLQSRVVRISQRFAKKLGSGLSKAASAAMKPTAVAVAAAFAVPFLASLGSSLASGVAAIAHGLGAALAIAPAAALAGAAAFGALSLAVSGVSDALTAALTGDAEEFSEAIEGLSPSARRFAREVRGLKTELTGLRQSVQERFFRPFASDVGELAQRYLPMTERMLGRIAGAFGRSVADVAAWAAEARTTSVINRIFGRTSATVENLAAGLGALPRALLPLIDVGSRFLPQLTSGFASATDRLAAMMERARSSGELQAWIQGGLDGLRDLWATTRQWGRILGNVGSILRTVFASSGLSMAGGLLDTIESLTERVQAFLQTDRAASAMASGWALVGEALAGIRDTATRVFRVLATVIVPLLPQIGAFAAAFLRLKAAVIDVALDRLTPVLQALGVVLGVAVLPALTALANWLAGNRPALEALAAVIMTLLVPAFAAWANTKFIQPLVSFGKATATAASTVGNFAKATASGMARAGTAVTGGLGRFTSGFRSAQAAESAFSGRLGTLGGRLRSGINAVGRFGAAAARGVGQAASAFARLAVQAATATARVVAAGARMAAQAAMATARVAASIALQIARWIALGVQAMLQAARVAAAWLISIWPIALIAAAVAGLVALFVIHFDSIKAVVAAAFNFVVGIISGAIEWIRTNWPLILAILTGPFGLAVLAIVKNSDTIKAGATAVKDWIVGRFNDVVGFITGLPGRIAAAASGMWSGITDAFRSAINTIIGWWNNLSFPSITIPSMDPLGSFGPSFGGGTFGGWALPDISYLAKGGRVPGPTLSMVGEGRQHEAVVPLDTFYAKLAAGFAQQAAAVRAGVNHLTAWAGGRIAAPLAQIQRSSGMTSHALRSVVKMLWQVLALPGWRLWEDGSVRIPGMSFAKGGIAKARPGGMFAQIAEAGEDEAVAPLSKLDAMIRRSVADVALAGAAGAPAPAPSALELLVTGGDDDLARLLRKWIRAKHGGNVQLALGQGR